MYILSYYVHQASESNVHALFECTGEKQSGTAALPFVNIYLLCYWDSNLLREIKLSFLYFQFCLDKTLDL